MDRSTIRKIVLGKRIGVAFHGQVVELLMTSVMVELLIRIGEILSGVCAGTVLIIIVAHRTYREVKRIKRRSK